MQQKLFYISNLLFLRNPLYFCKIFTTWSASLTNKSIVKVWSEDSLVILIYDGLKSLKVSIETLTVTHDLMQIPENPLI